MIYHLTINKNSGPIQDQSLSDADPDTERKAQAVSAAQKLVARAQAEAVTEREITYGDLWKAWAKHTAAFPEL